MANVADVAKAATTAYSEKNWDKVKDVFAADAVYDEKATHHPIQGSGRSSTHGRGGPQRSPTPRQRLCASCPSASPRIGRCYHRAKSVLNSPRCEEDATRRGSKS